MTALGFFFTKIKPPPFWPLINYPHFWFNSPQPTNQPNDQPPSEEFLAIVTAKLELIGKHNTTTTTFTHLTKPQPRKQVQLIGGAQRREG